MGKYPDSELLNKYSKWHWDNCKSKSFMSDADVTLINLPDVYRLWYEVRDIGGVAFPVAVIDIKSFKNREITWAEKAVYDWLLSKGLPVYIIYADTTFLMFEIESWEDKKKCIVDATEYIYWLDNLKRRRVLMKPK